MAVTPSAKPRLERIPARQSPNDPDMITIAVGNALRTIRAQVRSLSPDVSMLFPEPAIEYASAAPIVTMTNQTPANAVLAAVAAFPQPAFPASRNALAIAAPNHIRLRNAKPKMT